MISFRFNIFICPLFDVVLFSVPTLATSFYIIYFAYHLKNWPARWPLTLALSLPLLYRIKLFTIGANLQLDENDYDVGDANTCWRVKFVRYAVLRID